MEDKVKEFRDKNPILAGFIPGVDFIHAAKDKDYISMGLAATGLIIPGITEAVYNNEKTVYEIFGNDVIKVRSCMLLFASVSDIPIFQKMLEKHCWR